MRGDLRFQVVNPTLRLLPLDHPTRLRVPLRLGRVTFVSFCAIFWDAVHIVYFEGVKQSSNKPTSIPGPNTPQPTPTSATPTPNQPGWDDQPTTTPQTSSNPIERLKEGEVLISLSPSQEKNLYGLGFVEDDEDLTAMNPDEMELAYVAPWEKTVIPSAVDQLWSGYAEGQEEGSRKDRKASCRERVCYAV